MAYALSRRSNPAWWSTSRGRSRALVLVAWSFRWVPMHVAIDEKTTQSWLLGTARKLSCVIALISAEGLLSIAGTRSSGWRVRAITEQRREG
jgi:hypothetical protein